MWGCHCTVCTLVAVWKSDSTVGRPLWRGVLLGGPITVDKPSAALLDSRSLPELKQQPTTTAQALEGDWEERLLGSEGTGHLERLCRTEKLGAWRLLPCRKTRGLLWHGKCFLESQGLQGVSKDNFRRLCHGKLLGVSYLALVCLHQPR